MQAAGRSIIDSLHNAAKPISIIACVNLASIKEIIAHIVAADNIDTPNKITQFNMVFCLLILR
jgi:hypothetical protein